MCQLIKLENGSTAFICNCKKSDHVCNEDAAIMILKDGNRLPDTKENYELHYKNVVGGSVACSICGKALIDGACYL